MTDVAATAALFLGHASVRLPFGELQDGSRLRSHRPRPRCPPGSQPAAPACSPAANWGGHRAVHDEERMQRALVLPTRGTLLAFDGPAGTGFKVSQNAETK